MNINAKQQLVLRAIEMHPDAVNDDALLYATVWELEGWDSSKSLYDNLKRCTRGETISRRRRELHEMGLIVYDETTMKEREEAFISERDMHSDHQPGQAVSWLND